MIPAAMAVACLAAWLTVAAWSWLVEHGEGVERRRRDRERFVMEEFAESLSVLSAIFARASQRLGVNLDDLAMDAAMFGLRMHGAERSTREASLIYHPEILDAATGKIRLRVAAARWARMKHDERLDRALRQLKRDERRKRFDEFARRAFLRCPPTGWDGER